MLLQCAPVRHAARHKWWTGRHRCIVGAGKRSLIPRRTADPWSTNPLALFSILQRTCLTNQRLTVLEMTVAVITCVRSVIENCVCLQCTFGPSSCEPASSCLEMMIAVITCVRGLIESCGRLQCSLVPTRL